MAIENLDPELQDKLKACKTEEELRSLAEAVGLPLTDLQLEGIAGGAEGSETDCSDETCIGLGCDTLRTCVCIIQTCRSYSAPKCKIH